MTMRREETPVVTRISGAFPREEAAQAGAILVAIDAAMEEHADWLRAWHRAVVCRVPKVTGDSASPFGKFAQWYAAEGAQELLSQRVFVELWQAFRNMHDCGQKLLPKAEAGCLETDEYDAFLHKIGTFERLARRVRQAFQEATVDLDPLTGARNRRNMMDELEREKARSARMGTAFGIALCDVDHFKSVNDTYGHRAGDAVLISVVSRIVGKLRPYDSIFRYGGEEFLIALPDSGDEVALSIAERLCHTVRAGPVLLEDGTAVDVTASFGICIVDEAVTLTSAIERADRALYAAKSGGRDRVVRWSRSLDVSGDR